MMRAIHMIILITYLFDIGIISSHGENSDLDFNDDNLLPVLIGDEMPMNKPEVLEGSGEGENGEILDNVNIDSNVIIDKDTHITGNTSRTELKVNYTKINDIIPESNVIAATLHSDKSSETLTQTPVSVIVLMVILCILLVSALCVIIFQWTKIRKLRAVRRNQVFFNSPIVRKCADCDDECSVMMDWNTHS